MQEGKNSVKKKWENRSVHFRLWRVIYIFQIVEFIKIFINVSVPHPEICDF